MKLKIQIKSIYGAVLFEFEKENNTQRETILEAIKQKANLSNADLSNADLSYATLRNANFRNANLRYADLSYADLSNADLSNANLRNANLSYADLSNADLSNANLSNANLSNANFRNANLRYADLSYATLRNANLSNANLSNANLSNANLSNANLSNANLSNANLSNFKNDLWEILLRTKNEILGLKQKINEGKIDGSVYEGECCCLVGTIAVVRNCNYKSIPGVEPSASRPAEQWFSQFRKDMTPKNNDKLKLTMEWIEEFEMLLN